MNKNKCPYSAKTYVWGQDTDEYEMEYCPIETNYTGETLSCGYCGKEYKQCPIYNLQQRIDKTLELLNYVNEMKEKYVGYNPKEKDYLDKLSEILGGNND